MEVEGYNTTQETKILPTSGNEQMSEDLDEKFRLDKNISEDGKAKFNSYITTHNKTLHNVLKYDEDIMKNLVKNCPALSDFDKGDIINFFVQARKGLDMEIDKGTPEMKGKRKNDSSIERGSKKSRVVCLSQEQIQDIWKCLVQVEISEATFNGFFIKSSTDPSNKHLVVNLHSFQDGKLPKAISGFPGGYEGEFYRLFDKKIPNKITKPAESDPLRITLKRKVTAVKEGQTIENLEALPDAANLIFTKEDIVFCDGSADVLVLFDRNFKGVGIAPVSAKIYEMMPVHLFGFAPHLNYFSFSVPGEVMSVGVGSFLLSNQSIPGLSGCAVVCDESGGFIGYCGGATTANDGSPFGSYAFPLSYVYQNVRRVDAEKSTTDESS